MRASKVKLDEFKNNLSSVTNEKLMVGFREQVKKELQRQCLEIELEIAKQYAATDWRLWQKFGTSDVIC